MQAVVIGTSKGREAWAKDCYASVEGCGYPVIILDRYGYELGKIRWVMEHTDIDEFLFLQDSVVVKDHKLFNLVFSHSGSVSITNVPSLFGCYLGKYRREILRKFDLPIVNNKHDAVRHETNWTRCYADADKDTINLFDDLDLPEKHRFEERHGRNNLVLENDYLVKYKGTWHTDMIENDA